MTEGKWVLCILSAMIGAGFASGREIMQFFSRWGNISWGFIGCAVVTITACMTRLMQAGACGMDGLFPKGKGVSWGKVFLTALLVSTGGGMAAAGGEIAALVLPVRYARGYGFLLTLILSVLSAPYPGRILPALGKLLIPAVIVALVLCIRIPVRQSQAKDFSWFQITMGFFQVIGYSGTNVLLSAGVLCQVGGRCNQRGMCRGAAWTGGAIGALLSLGNAALLPHAASLNGEALPMVLLLRTYGKAGYYLSAGILYLAILTTLIAVLQGMGAMIRGKMRYPYVFAGLMMGMIGLMGFEKIVAVAYPVLGLISMLFIWMPRRKSVPCKAR